MSFSDRADAGRQLADALAEFKSASPLVLALPRGGVPVAARVARALDAPLELLLVRKIGVPRQPELAAGAVVDGTDPIVVRNEDVIRMSGMSEDEFNRTRDQELRELRRRRELYVGGRPFPDLRGRTVIVVDDGVATGATMRAALRGLRALQPRQVVLATPVGPPDTIMDLGAEADRVICLEIPEPFGSIGSFYRDFRQVEDEEVIAILAESRSRASPT